MYAAMLVCDSVCGGIDIWRCAGMCVKLCVCVHYVCKHACVQPGDVQGQYVQMNILDCSHAWKIKKRNVLFVPCLSTKSKMLALALTV